MREIVLDTETTGLDPATGDRIAEIGAIELMNHLPTGNTLHLYVNPGRPMPAEAFAVHGLSDEFLRDKPPFHAVARQFLDFIGESVLVIHNATFDMGFLDHELAQAGHERIGMARVIDTLTMARQRFPGSPASLDALCRRFGVDNSRRVQHGALLDCELLAQVYLELLGGRQPGLLLAEAAGPAGTPAGVGKAIRAKARPAPLAPRLTENEATAHDALVESLGEGALWRRHRQPT